MDYLERYNFVIDTINKEIEKPNSLLAAFVSSQPEISSSMVIYDLVHGICDHNLPRLEYIGVAIPTDARSYFRYCNDAERLKYVLRLIRDIQKKKIHTAMQAEVIEQPSKPLHRAHWVRGING